MTMLWHHILDCTNINTEFVLHTHTHTHLTALFPGLPGWAGTRKVKPIWILLKQETVSGSDISWAICKSASRSRQITMPVLHHSKFFTGQMPFLPLNQQHQSTEGKSTEGNCPSHNKIKIIHQSFSVIHHTTVKISKHNFGGTAQSALTV